MLKYQWTNSYKRENEPNIPKITDTNAEWVLFQIGRMVQISKLSASKIKNKYRMNWILPDLLKEDFYDMLTYCEADLYEIVMDTFLKFLAVNEKELSYEKYRQIDKIIEFVKSIVYTKIKIEDTEVMIYTDNNELKRDIKKAIQNERYKLRTIANESEAKLWWEPITNGS